jgi:hypothetical protein
MVLRQVGVISGAGIMVLRQVGVISGAGIMVLRQVGVISGAGIMVLRHFQQYLSYRSCFIPSVFCCFL